MQVSAIDHVNIVTDDLDETIRFYEHALGLRAGESPAAAMGIRGAWLFDAANNPIVHLMVGERSSAADTGAVHHVAFKCEGFDEAVTRLEAMGADYRASDQVRFGVRQIFLRDPNNINLELNFRES